MAVSLMSPKTVGTTQNPSAGGGIGRAGTKFTIEVEDYQFSGQVNLQNVTGDGDAGSTFAEDEPIHAFSVRGSMVADAAMGVANLGDSSATLEMLLSSTRKISGTAIVRSYRIAGSRKAGRMQVALAGVWNGGAPTEAAVS